MIQIPWRRVAGVALVMCLLLANTSYAETTQDNINDAKNQIEDLKDQKKDAEDTVNDISGKKDALESDLSGLNGQLSDIVAQINDLEGQISDKQGEIDQAKEDLAAAETQSAKQYEDMKLRIQFMYENGSTPVWQMLAEAESFSDFLNRTEYITDINAYDRKKLVEYQDLQEQIAAQKEDLESDMTELVAMQDDMKKKQANVSSLINTTKANLAQTQEDLADAQSNVADLEDKINQMVEYEKQLEIQKAKEDAARLAAIKEQEKEDTSTVVYVPTDSDQYLLGAIIQCEAGGEGEDGMKAVAGVVMNRVHAKGGEYARVGQGSIRNIIFQPYQFVCASETEGGAYNPQNIYNMRPEQIHYDIADWAIAGNRLPDVADSLWFYNPFGPTCRSFFPSKVGYWQTRIGDHCFYNPTDAYYQT